MNCGNLPKTEKNYLGKNFIKNYASPIIWYLNIKNPKLKTTVTDFFLNV